MIGAPPIPAGGQPNGLQPPSSLSGTATVKASAAMAVTGRERQNLPEHLSRQSTDELREHASMRINGILPGTMFTEVGVNSASTSMCQSTRRPRPAAASLARRKWSGP